MTTTESKLVRQTLVFQKSKPTIWRKKWLKLTEDQLSIYASEVSSPQTVITLNDIKAVERTVLKFSLFSKPYHLLLKTRGTGKDYHFAFRGQEELYGWHLDIYSRLSLGGHKSMESESTAVGQDIGRLSGETSLRVKAPLDNIVGELEPSYDDADFGTRGREVVGVRAAKVQSICWS